MFIYVIINHVNWKLYVGKTKNKDLQQYWRCQKRGIFEGNTSTSKPYLYNAVRKDGWENFSIHPLITDCKTDEELLYWEKVLIKALGTQKYGYNICAGGRGTIGWKPSLEQLAHMSAAAKKGRSPAQLAALKSPERSAKIRQAVHRRIATGAYHSSETKAEISIKLKGKVRTPEQRQRYREASPKTRPWHRGWNPTSKTRERMSNAHKNQVPANKGSQWIHNPITKERKMVGNPEVFILEGWKLGMK